MNLTQFHDTGFITVPSNAISASTVDNQNTGMTRDANESREHRYRERLPAQTWQFHLLNLFVGLLLVCTVNAAEEPPVLPVWPGAVPADYGTIGPERVRAPSEAP